MEHATLSSLINALEKGKKMHITVAFLNNYGNRKTKCTYNQTVHDRPVCRAIKKSPYGMDSCYRCRNIVQKTVVRYRKSVAGFCTNGVYEYCRPVIHNNKVICVIFIGNILTDNIEQRRILQKHVDNELLQTMEQYFSPEDCIETAHILESYITFLFEHYGIENKHFDPLVENIKSYIRENLSYEFSMETLAATFNYTSKYLGKLFKSRTGQSIKEYCNQLKVEQAKHLLRESDLDIEIISYQSGFNSTTYFDRVFRKLTGISPRAYRTSEKNGLVG